MTLGADQYARPHWCEGRRRGLAGHISDTAPKRRRYGGCRRAQERLAAVPVGGGGAWPGFETTRRAKLAAPSEARGAERSSRRGRLAGGPPPTGTTSSPAHRTARAAPQATQQQAPQHHARHTKTDIRDRMSACGGARGIRTPDLLIANETRYQLRHSPKDSNSLAPSQSAMQADHRRVRHDTEPTHATAPRARRPAARHQQLRDPLLGASRV